MTDMNIDERSLDALYQMASRFLGYSGPKSSKALEDFAKSSPAAAAKLGAYSSAMAKGGMVRGLAKGGPITMGMGGVGEAEGSVQVWFYNGRQYSNPQAAQNARNKDLAAMAPTPTPTTTTPTTTTPTTTTPTTTTPEEPVNTYDVKSGKPTDESDPFYQENLDTYNQYISSLSSGYETPIDVTEAKNKVAQVTNKVAKIAAALAENPDDVAAQEALAEAQKEYALAQSELNIASSQFSTTNIPSAGEVIGKGITDPMSMITKAGVSEVKATPDTVIAEGTGQVEGVVPVDVKTVDQPELAVMPEVFDAETIEATKISDEVKAELEELEAAKGTVSKEGLVRGQLEILMEDFENDGTPPWASGAMRAAMGIMQSRGLGASSIAGQAVVQAAMESAVAIATQDAKTVAQFELQNLTNEQETLIFKTQQRIAAMVSDQSAENAAKQFNASSENQTKQFFADLQSTISRFNADQINAVNQFNAGQENAMEQFNTQIKAARDQFNAANSLIIAQANAKWMQEISTANTAAANIAAREAAAAANSLTEKAMDDLLQRERDIMAYSFSQAENASDRNLSLLVADKEVAANQALLNQKIEANEDAGKTQTALYFIDKALDWL